MSLSHDGGCRKSTVEGFYMVVQFGSVGLVHLGESYSPCLPPPTRPCGHYYIYARLQFGDRGVCVFEHMDWFFSPLGIQIACHFPCL